jgi:hypothetical protein
MIVSSLVTVAISRHILIHVVFGRVADCNGLQPSVNPTDRAEVEAFVDRQLRSRSFVQVVDETSNISSATT